MVTKKQYNYDVFYLVYGSETATATVQGKNWNEAKANFKKTYGDCKITHHQRLRY